MEQDKPNAKWIRRLLPLVVLIAGVLITVLMVKARRPPKRETAGEKGPLVEVLIARKEARRVEVRSQGTVQPCRQATIASQVPGRVIWVHPSLVVGGTMGQVLQQCRLLQRGGDYFR